MRSILILAAFAVIGCGTTIRELRDHPPRAVYSSARSVPALEQCLAERLSWIDNPSVIRGETYTQVVFGSGGKTALSVTLMPAAARTTVEVRQVYVYGARVRGNVEMCVEGREP